MEIKSKSIEVNGLNINYIDENYCDEGKEKVIFLIHGWASSIGPWECILPSLKERKYRIIALDLPGCGSSDELESPWDIDNYCDFILDFLKEINVKDPVLMGHSHGGRIILHLVGNGRINPPKIVLVDSAGIPAELSLAGKVKSTLVKVGKAIIDCKLWSRATAGMSEDLRMMTGSEDYKNANEVMRKTLVSVINTDARPVMNQIKCPTLLIWGDLDTATPISDAKQMEQLIPDCGLCTVKGTGHFSFMENADLANAVLYTFL